MSDCELRIRIWIAEIAIFEFAYELDWITYTGSKRNCGDVTRIVEIQDCTYVYSWIG